MIMNSETPAVIELRGVTKKYGRKLACDAVDLTVHPFSEDLFEQLVSENHAISGNVVDLSLEDIFKDVIRGRKRQNEEIEL